MDAELWQKANQIFQNAIELDPAERQAFLETVCGSDAVLRAEVESLLQADSRDWKFIEGSALESAAPLLADEQPQLAPGDNVAHYQIIRLIGRGGMGEVYLANDPTLDRNVALKLLPDEYTRNKERLRRFQLEARAASALNHPNILTIHQLGETDGRYFIATEYIEGETLRERISRGPIPLQSAVELTIQIASALATAHRAGIVHRDVKPENMMIRPDGYLKVLDFGLAKLADSGRIADISIPGSAEDAGEASSGLFMGTARYMSPEQIKGLNVDERSDIFSLGIVLYEMVTGKPPFEEKNPRKTVESILKDGPPALSEYLERPPERLGAIIARCLAKEPRERYAAADDLLADLDLLRDDLNPTRSGSAIRRLISPVIAVPMLLLAAAIAFAAYVYLTRSPARTPVAPTMSDTSWRTIAGLSAPRSGAMTVALNGTLYVVGGANECTRFKDLELYDPAGNRWVRRAPMSSERGAHAVAVLDGMIYAVGGETGCGYESAIATVEAYDPLSDSWSPKPPLPAKRIGLTAAVVNGKLYAIGGSADGVRLDSNLEFDPRTNRWTERASMPTPRFGAASVALNGLIYVIGGDGGGSTVEAYDSSTDSWSVKAPMPTSRQSHSASVMNGRIYVFGGFNRGQIEVYDPVTNSWTTDGQMSETRAQFGTATLNGSIYMVGGFNGVSYLADAAAYTPEGSSPRTEALCANSEGWTKRAPMPTRRMMPAIAELNGAIHIVGGQDGAVVYLANNEAYDPMTDTWSKKAPMPTPREVRGTNNAVVNGRLYMIGGDPRAICTGVNEVYDPATDSWSRGAPMPTPRCHATVIAANGLIYTIGGNVNNSFSAIVEVYDPVSDSWTTAPPMPTQRQETAAGVIDGRIYVVGGFSQYGSLDTVEIYDPALKTWNSGSPMRMTRVGSAGAVVRGRLAVMGGYSFDRKLSSAEIYDPVADAWSPLPSMPTERGFLAATAIGDTIYAIGGSNDPDLHRSLAANESLKLVPCAE